MNRFLSLLLVTVLAVGAAVLVWRTGEREVAGPPPPNEERDSATAAAATAASAAAAADSVIGPVQDVDLPRALVADEALDLTGDGAPERLQLYLDIERGEDGSFHWDDGQRWLLIARAGGAIYPLLDEYVQIGRVRFWVVQGDAGQAPRIVVLRETGSGVRLRAFHYAPPDRFAVRDVSAVSGNVVYTSPELR